MKRQEPKQSPVATVNVGRIVATIWETVNDRGTFHRITFERRYRGKDGYWKAARSFKAGSDVPALLHAVAFANDRILNVTMGPSRRIENHCARRAGLCGLCLVPPARLGSLMDRLRGSDREVAALPGDFGGTLRPDSSDRGQPLLDHRPEAPRSCVFDRAQLGG